MDVVCYSVGIVSASACAPADFTPEQVATEVNAQHPTGISSRWEVAEEQQFATGEPMPAPCNQGANRRHWLLHC